MKAKANNSQGVKSDVKVVETLVAPTPTIIGLRDLIITLDFAFIMVDKHFTVIKPVSVFGHNNQRYSTPT